MSKFGVFKIPREYKDEDKWFRYFNKKQAVILVLTLLADYRFLLWANTYGHLMPAVIAAILFTLIIAAVIMIELPTEAMFLTGGGITLEQCLVRLIIRKRNRVIYVKNYEPEDGI